jgi:hypothetical protein
MSQYNLQPNLALAREKNDFHSDSQIANAPPFSQGWLIPSRLAGPLNKTRQTNGRLLTRILKE